MELNVCSDPSAMKLNKAILLYTGNTHGKPTRAFATIHDVSIQETANGFEPEIQAGKPMTTSAVAEVLSQLVQKQVETTCMLTDKVLSISDSHIVWYLPAGKRRVFANISAAGDVSAVIPHPTLIFAVVGGQWYVFAIAKRGRPNQNSLVYKAPFLNVYEAGSICSGSARRPDGIRPDDLAKWEDAFFSSKFTHMNSREIVNFPGGGYRFWDALLKGDFERFPNKVLLKYPKRLGDLLNETLYKGSDDE